MYLCVYQRKQDTSDMAGPLCLLKAQSWFNRDVKHLWKFSKDNLKTQKQTFQPLSVFFLSSLPERPSLWISTWCQEPSLTLACVALTLIVPEPMSSSKYSPPSSNSTAKKSTLLFFWPFASLLSWGLPWVKRISPLGSEVRKSKEMEPTRLVFHFGKAR